MSRVAVLFCLLLQFSLPLAIKVHIEVLPRQVRSHIEGITYESLQDVFQSYPVDRHNTDQTWKLLRTCDGLSGYREIIHASTGQYSRIVVKPCYSVLQNCRFEESMTDAARFCLSSDPHRRYDYMELSQDRRYKYGRNLVNECPPAKYETYYSYGAFYPCVCDCESSEREINRYFSLLEVVSDGAKVVTGFRLRKIDHVFYIQIQQTEFGWNQIIRGQVEWKPVKQVSRSELLSPNVSEYYKAEGNDDNFLKFHKNDLVYAVTSEQNTVLLDDLKGGLNEVLTGLRFRQVGQDLRFEIQVTPYNNVIAMLDRSRSEWLYNDMDKSERREVKLKSLDVPGQSDAKNIMHSNNQFIKFQVSDFKADLGQTTVPFIDITDVNLYTPRILSGAGIFHEGSIDSAGFITLKGIIT